MAETYIHRKLIEEFQTRPVLTRKDLLNFFHQYEPDLNEGAFTWRIFDLKRRSIIGDLKKGVYTLHNKPSFEPALNKTILSIDRLIKQHYDPHFYNIWDTIWLNELTELQAATSLVVLEVEKGSIDSVFFALKDNGYHEIFIKPDAGMVERYVSEAKHPVIIKPFLSRSPIQLIQDVKAPALEKILVDLYCDEETYFAFQGHQLSTIYQNVAARYSLNFSKLFTYAKRRSREDEIKNIFRNVLDEDLKKIIE